MREPSVDVAIVTYNHASYLRAALDGVFSQKTNFPVRIVIGDDCSTDGTQDIVREYAAKHPNQMEALLPNEHLGLDNEQHVFHSVLLRCTAPYLAYLDGDDYWTDPLKLQKQIDQLEQHAHLMVSFHPVAPLDQATGRFHPSRRPPSSQSEFSLDDLLAALNFVGSCSVVYRNIFRGNFPSWIRTVRLGDLALHALHAAQGELGFLDETMAVYRVHETGAWSSMKALRRIDETVSTYHKLAHNLEISDSYGYRLGLSRLAQRRSRHLWAEGHRAKALGAIWTAFRLAPRSRRDELLASLPGGPGIGLGRFLLQRPKTKGPG